MPLCIEVRVSLPGGDWGAGYDVLRQHSAPMRMTEE
jgi:hypothetical protein